MNSHKQFHTRLILNKKGKAALLLGAVCLLLAVFVGAVLLSPAFALSPETISLVQATITNQQETEKNILFEYEIGGFSFTSPLVIQNPYGTAPLTALLIFDTPEAAQISIHVPGKTSQAAVDFTFAGFLQHHEIPVYGLYPDALNVVTVSMKLQTGVASQTDIKLQTEALPVYVANIQVDKLNRDQYSPGFNFTYANYKMIFDIDGAVRWYSTQETFRVFTKLKNGRYLYTYSLPNSEDQVVMEEDLLGKVYAIYNETDGVQHDIYELPDGNYLLTSQDSASNTNQDWILEIDRTSGHVVRSFDLKQILDSNRQTVPDGTTADWLHVNSIVYDASDSSIIISSRSQSAVIKLSYPEMKIQWILGPHEAWSAQFQPYLLTPVGQNFEWPWTQHDAALYSMGQVGDHSVDIILFDNGLYRSFNLNSAAPLAKSYSMVVHYRINQSQMTVEQVWEYGKERGSAIFSVLFGSGTLQANGNVLGTWGDIRKDAAGNPAVDLVQDGTEGSKIIEVNPTTDEVASEYSFQTTSYRAFRDGVYHGYSESSNFLSTALDDTSANDLQDRSVLLWRDVNRWLSPAGSTIQMVFHDLISAISG